MDRRTLTASVLASAVGLATAAAITPAVSAPLPAAMQKKLDMVLKEHPGANKNVIIKNMKRVAAQHLQKCYGINAVGKNDCAAGAHSCAGQSTQARDTNAFVLLPAGDCGKIAGGALKPAQSKS
jgi:uncharacterized membrane protein